jgi:hypothetical protein
MIEIATSVRASSGDLTTSGVFPGKTGVLVSRVEARQSSRGLVGPRRLDPTNRISPVEGEGTKPKTVKLRLSQGKRKL